MHEKFNSINELEVLLEKTDNAEVQDAWYGGSNPKIYSEWKTIYNTTKERPVTMVRQARGNVINHSDALTPFVSALKQQEGANIFGFFHNHGDKVTIDCLFNNVVVDDGSEGGIRLGLTIQNSYNNLNVSGESYGYRNYCNNGMPLGKSIGARLSCTHKSISNLDSQLNFFIENSLNKAKILTDTIEKAKADKFVSEEDALKTLIGEVTSERTAKKMLELIEVPGNFSRWQIYNTITNFATHVSTKENQKYWLQAKAQKILTTDSNNLVRGELKADKEDFN